MFKHLKNDIPASIVVFFVALPLCLGIALASDAPPLSGLIAGIIGGIIVGFISKSKIGVSGPAAGLAAIVAGAIASLGSFEIFLSAVVLAGVLQLLFGMLRMGVIGYYFPNSVIKGMLAGIGIIIILKQIPHFFGYDTEVEGADEFIEASGENTFSAIAHVIDNVTLGAFIIGAIGLFIILFWDNFLSKKHSFFKLVQGSLIAVLIGTVLQIIFSGNPSLVIEGEHLVQVRVLEEISEVKSLLRYPDFSQFFTKEVWIVAFTLALVASIETLLSVEATDKLDPDKNITPTNRELFAQGFGNITSGLVGGLPITQVVVRSSANVQSNAKSKMSAILHGILLLVSILAIPTILNHIPKSVLASILIVVGYKLAKPSMFKKMFQLGWTQYLPFIFTVLMIVFTNLLIGIFVGLTIGLAVVLIKNYKNSFAIQPQKGPGSNTVKMTFAEEISFLNKAAIQKELLNLPENSRLELDISKTTYLDYDVVEILEDFIIQARNKNIQIYLISERGNMENPASFIEFLKQKNKLNYNRMKTLNKEIQAQITPREALEILQKGNHRFVNNLKAHRNLLEQVNETSDGQWPFAIILSCIDSRTSAELIFDQGLGDVFSVRIAGNIVNTDILGSMEFACKVAGSKLIVVLGHSKCGAVKGACDHVEMGNLTELLSKIQPAVYQEKATLNDRSSKNADFVENVAEINVVRSVKNIIERSYILEQMVERGEIGVVGAMHNIETGEVSFYEDVMFIKDEQNPNFSVEDLRY